MDYTALGIVKAYCNSAQLGEDVLTPGWTDYHIRIPYYTEDLTNKLKIGDNVLAFALGNGWAVGKIGWFGDKHYAGRPMMWCRISIVYQDGTSECFGSDKSFVVSFGKTLENDLLDGEVQDARLSEAYRTKMNNIKRRYEEIRGGAEYENSENIVPTRDDFASVYTVLRREFRSGTSILDMKTLLRLVNSYDIQPINYIKMKYVLRIMNELRICAVEEISDDIFKFEVFFNAAKTSIDKSSILKKLKSKCLDRVK